MRKILIVDDTRAAQADAYAVLEKEYEVLFAVSAEEALQLCTAEDRPDMVIYALKTPYLTGLELQRRMTELYGERIPFLFLLTEEEEERRYLSLDADATDYVLLPCRSELLLHRVSNIMRHIDSLQQLRGLRAVAETDTMTGLLNRRSVQKTLTELCARSSGILMMIDLDNFKLVNDLYGHGMGDRVLVRFAEILRSSIRSSDVAGRMGGDEFIVFCRDIRSERLIAEKTASVNANLLAAAKEFMGDDMNIPLGASMGAVFVPDEGTSFIDLYRKADKALYSVKQNGKHGYAFFHGGEGRATAEPRKGASESLETVRAILDERGHQGGAYELGLENFRCVFRFLMRGMEVFRYDAELILFTFAPDIPEDVVDTFGVMLRQVLRRSDAYAKSSNRQFMALLPQPLSAHGEVAIRRILENWHKLNDTPVTVEHESLTLGN